jgi:hypothetical protein
MTPPFKPLGEVIAAPPSRPFISSKTQHKLRIGRNMMHKSIYKLTSSDNWFLEVDGKHVGQFFSKEMAEAAFALMVDRDNDHRNN